jgi:hypothetical protein
VQQGSLLTLQVEQQHCHCHCYSSHHLHHQQPNPRCLSQGMLYLEYLLLAWHLWQGQQHLLLAGLKAPAQQK